MRNVKKYNVQVIYVLVVFLLISIIVFSQSEVFNKKSNKNLDSDNIQSVSFTKDIKLRSGNINGVHILIPSTYLYFPVEYKNKSIWEKSKSSDKQYEDRGFKDAIGAFSLFVNWPDLEPRHLSNRINPRINTAQNAHAEWLIIEVNGYARPSPPQTPDNALARVLRGKLRKLSAEYLARWPVKIIDKTDPNKKRRINTRNLRYEMRGIDQITGLNWAIPIGDGAERFYSWNISLYWRGDINATVSDLIECYNGKLENMNSVSLCSQSYELKDWKAGVTVKYPRRMLSKWRDIKSRTIKLIYSFQITKQDKKKAIFNY